MDDEPVIHYLRHSVAILAVFLALAAILPLLAAYLLGQSVPVTAALIGSAFIIEYGAAPVGIYGGLDPVFVLFVLSCIALAVTLLLFSLGESLGEHWPRFARFLERTRNMARSSAILSKYGIWGLFPLVIVLGFYVCAPVAVIFGWRRDHSTILIMAGYVLASIITIAATHGASMVFIPQA